MPRKTSRTTAPGPGIKTPAIERKTLTGETDSNFPAAQKAAGENSELRILRAIRRIIRAIELHSRQLMSQHNITGPQLICLMTVAERQPVTQGVLAGEVHLSPSTVIGILDRLEAKGLVRRERDQRDRRFIRVSITALGQGLVDRAPSPLQDTLSEALRKLPPSELLNLSVALERIVELMRIQHIDASPILETGPIDPPVKDGKP